MRRRSAPDYLTGFHDIEESVFEYLPAINLIVPGAGITPFNVWDLTFDWWQTYVRLVVEHDKKSREARRGN